MKIYEIAVVPGDGIGKEVVPEGLNVLEAIGSAFGIGFHFRHFDWSCETYKKTGRMMPEDGIDRLRDHDAIFLGAVGFPGVDFREAVPLLAAPGRLPYSCVFDPTVVGQNRSRAG